MKPFRLFLLIYFSIHFSNVQAHALSELKEYYFPQLNLSLNYFANSTNLGHQGGWKYAYTRRSNGSYGDSVFKSTIIIDTLLKGTTKKHISSEIDNFKNTHYVNKESEYKYIGQGLYMYFITGKHKNGYSESDLYFFSSKNYSIVCTFSYRNSENQKIEVLRENILLSIKENKVNYNFPDKFLSIPLKGRLQASSTKEAPNEVIVHDIYSGDTYDYFARMEVTAASSPEQIKTAISEYQQILSKDANIEFKKSKSYNEITNEFYWIKNYHETSVGFNYLVKSSKGGKTYVQEYILVVPDTWQLLKCRVTLYYPQGEQDLYYLNSDSKYFIKDIMHNVVKEITILPPGTTSKNIDLSKGFCIAKDETTEDKINTILRSSVNDYSSIIGQPYPIINLYYNRYYSYVQLGDKYPTFVDYDTYDYMYNVKCELGMYPGRTEAEPVFNEYRNVLTSISSYPFGSARFENYSSSSSDLQYYVYPKNPNYPYEKTYVRLIMDSKYRYDYGNLKSFYFNQLIFNRKKN